MNIRIEQFFLRIARPLYLLGGVLFYALGVGIARYLGNPVNWGLVILGQIWVTIFQLGFHFLITYFHHPQIIGAPNRIQINDDREGKAQYIRVDLILSAAFTAFAVAAILGLLFLWWIKVSGVVFMIMGLMIIFVITLVVPPFQIIKTGYGDLLQAILVANLIPGIAFSLQYGELHRLVAMSTFPLTLLYLSTQLAQQFQSYGNNILKNKTTLLTIMGWERGMMLHNLLILIAYFLFGVAMLFGLSPRVTLPVFFVLPLGIFQIWYMTRIAAGAKPNWRLLNSTAIFVLGLTTYLLAFSYWIR